MVFCGMNAFQFIFPFGIMILKKKRRKWSGVRQKSVSIQDVLVLVVQICSRWDFLSIWTHLVERLHDEIGEGEIRAGPPEKNVGRWESTDLPSVSRMTGVLPGPLPEGAVGGWEQ